MSNNGEDQTQDRIVLAALAVFAEFGIGKASMNEIAHRAGMTRVTVYRYFSEKKELVRAAFLRGERVFQDALAHLEHNPQADWKKALDQIGEDLSALPRGDVFARFDELKRLYPDVYDDIQAVRAATLDGIFEHIFAAAERAGTLRPALNRDLVQAIFWELTVNFFDNPRFEPLGLSDAELFRAMTDVLLYGIFGD